jgi:hypothetical protein
MPKQHDLAVIGAGAGGLIAARFAAKLGAHVLLVEKDRIGGDCTWTGCVPSKSLIRVKSRARDPNRVSIRHHGVLVRRELAGRPQLRPTPSLIVHPVSALVFQADRSTGAVMTQLPRDPSAPLLARPLVVCSALSGAVLAATTFATYWWQSRTVGEVTARTLALIVLLAGYQMLLFVERLSIPESMSRVPRSPLFWIVWMASALSLALLIYVPPAARLFHLESPRSGATIILAIVAGLLSVGWRLLVRTSRGAKEQRRNRATL